MAIYHCTVKAHSRTASSANHAVRSAAYRAGTILIDEQSGTKYNYSRKSEVVHSEIMLPKGAPSSYKSRQTLWNEIEKKEIRKDAQLFREIEVALPIELTKDQMIDLIRDYVQASAVKYGMAADFSIHFNDGNPHCHIMLTMRDLNDDGFGNKNREWNDKKFIERWRKDWAVYANKHLERAGFSERIDHRSYEAQGIDVKPTVHEGREGIGGQNRQIVKRRRIENENIKELNAVNEELAKEKKELAELSKQIADASINTTSNVSVIRGKILNSIPLRSVESREVKTVASRSSSPLKQRIKESLKPVEPSNCTGLVRYTQPIPHFKDPLETQACYALRAVLGKQADEEYESRLELSRLAGLKYSWTDYYSNFGKHAKGAYGENIDWWRAFAISCYYHHSLFMSEIIKNVPEKYINHFNDAIQKDIKKKCQPPIYRQYRASKFVVQLKNKAPPKTTAAPPIEPVATVPVQDSNVETSPNTDVSHKPNFTSSPYYINPTYRPKSYWSSGDEPK